MIREFVILGGAAVLGLIFARRYVRLEKDTSLRALLFRPRNLFRHRPHDEGREVTVDEFIPAASGVDAKVRAQAEGLLKKAEIAAGRAKKPGRNGTEEERKFEQEAEKFLIQAIAVDPSCIEAYKRLGMMYLTQEQFGKAEGIYRKLVVSIVNDAALLSNLGLALYAQKKLPEAKECYVKALAIDAKRPGRFFSLAQVLVELKEFDEAFENLKKAIAMDPGKVEYQLTLIHLYEEQDMLEEARQLVATMLVDFPDNEEVKALGERLKVWV